MAQIEARKWAYHESCGNTDINEIFLPAEGLVTGIGSSEGDGQVTMSHGSAFVSPPSLSGRDHPARDRARSRRWSLSSTDARPWRRQAVDPRRLGPRAARARAAS